MNIQINDQLLVERAFVDGAYCYCGSAIRAAGHFTWALNLNIRTICTCTKSRIRLEQPQKNQGYYSALFET